MNQHRKSSREHETTASGNEGVVREGHPVVEESIRAKNPVRHEETASSKRATRVATPGAVDHVVAATRTTGTARGDSAAEPIPTMTPDNTGSSKTTGSMMADAAANDVINRVRPGMRVVDANGEELGTVDDLKMGDPGAATVGADQPAEPGLIGGLFGADAEPDVPEPLPSRLLRFGYVKIDGKGWLDTDRYPTADLIGRVSGDTVALSVAKDRVLDDRG